MTDVSRDYLIAGEEIAAESLAPVEPGDIGTELRAARQTRKIDISKVATDLKIREDFLLAIENGRYSDLPGIPYAIGYIRTYATYLGLDAEDLVHRFKDETDGLHAEPDLAFPMPVKEGRLGGPALIGLSLILAGLAYGAWYYYSQAVDETVTALPSTTAPAGDNPAAKATAETPGAKPPETRTATVKAPDTQTPDTQTAARPPSNPAATASDQLRLTAPVSIGAATAPPALNNVELDAAAAAVATANLPRPVAPEPAVTQSPRLDRFGPGPNAAAPGPESAHAIPANKAPPASKPTASKPTASKPVGPKPAGPKRAGIVLAGNLAAGATAPTLHAAVKAAAQADLVDAVSGDQRATAPAPRPKVTLRATGLTWVRIHDGGGKAIVSRVLRPGARIEVPRQPGLTLHVGRANRLQVVVGERVVPAMAEDSLPVYDVSLEPSELLKPR